MSGNIILPEGFVTSNGMVRTGYWNYAYLSDIMNARDLERKMADGDYYRTREIMAKGYLDNADRLVLSEKTIQATLKAVMDGASQGIDVFSRGSIVQPQIDYTHNLNQILGELGCINDTIGNGLDGISESMDRMAAGFSFAFSELTWHLSEIKDLIESPSKTKAVEYRERGVKYFGEGWIDEAERAFEKAKSIYECDPVTRQYLGLINLRYRNNLNRARQEFEATAKYVMTRDADEEERKVARYAYLHVALTHYYQNNFVEAANAAAKAVRCYADEEPQYQLGHYLALISDPPLGKIIKLFENAIRSDPVYFLKIDQDQKIFERDLYKIGDIVRGLKTSLYEEQKSKVGRKLRELRKIFNNTTYTFLPQKERDHVRELLVSAERIFAEHQSYIDYRTLEKVL